MQATQTVAPICAANATAYRSAFRDRSEKSTGTSTRPSPLAGAISEVGKAQVVISLDLARCRSKITCAPAFRRPTESVSLLRLSAVCRRLGTGMDFISPGLAFLSCFVAFIANLQ